MNNPNLKIALTIFIVWTSTVSTTLGQMTVVEEDVDRRGTRYTYKMTLTPSAEPMPAFKYRFSTPLHKTINANAMSHYLRAFGEGGFRGMEIMEQEIGWEEISRYCHLQPGENQIDLPKLKKYSAMFDSFVSKHIQRGSRCRYSDWGIGEEDLRGPAIYEMLLPSVQQMRSVSRVLSMRTRLAIREGRFGDSVDHLRMNYQLGKNVASMKVLVTKLVAIAICGIANDSLKEHISTPNSPNLYWALAELPRPLIDTKDAMRLELSGPQRLLPVLEQVLDDPTTELAWEHELKSVVSDTIRLIHVVNGSIPPASYAPIFQGFNSDELSQAIPVASGLLQYTKAKKRLAQYDFSEHAIEKMPVAKVLLLDTAFESQRIIDEYYKFTCNETPDKSLAKSFDELLQRESSALNAGVTIVRLVAPVNTQVKRVETRLTWQLNALQIIEAIRMHAAKHSDLPKTLQDIEVPIPNNPFTHEPYEYRLRAGTAILELPFGQAVGMAQRYELTLAK